MDIKTKIESLIQDCVNENGCYIDDIEYVQEHGSWYLRIYLDQHDKPIDLDTVVMLSEKISDIIDEEDPIAGEYMLEVSSPGAEKELKTIEQVRAKVGSYVYMKLSMPIAGINELYGTILSMSDDDVLEVQYLVKNIKKKINIEYKRIGFIRLAVKF